MPKTKTRRKKNHEIYTSVLNKTYEMLETKISNAKMFHCKKLTFLNILKTEKFKNYVNECTLKV